MSTRDITRRLRQAIIGLACLASAVPVPAAVLNLSPLMLSLAPDERAAGLDITNQAASPVTLQIRLMRWTQDGDRNLYETAPGWVISPPMVVVPGGQSQLLRVIRRQIEQAPVEQAYRVFIDELPGADAPAGGAVRVLMRYSLPLFVEPNQAGLPDVGWTLQSCGKGWYLRGDNQGQRHFKLLGYSISQHGKRLAETPDGLLGYILAGRSFGLAIDDVTAPQGEDGLRIRVRSPAGDQEAALRLAKDAAGCPVQS